jgi:hypothetical protein
MIEDEMHISLWLDRESGTGPWWVVSRDNGDCTETIEFYGERCREEAMLSAKLIARREKRKLFGIDAFGVKTIIEDNTGA